MTPAGKLHAALKKHRATHGRDVPFLLADARELDSELCEEECRTYRGTAYLDGRAVECVGALQLHRHPGAVVALVVGRCSDALVGIAYHEGRGAPNL